MSTESPRNDFSGDFIYFKKKRNCEGTEQLQTGFI